MARRLLLAGGIGTGLYFGPFMPNPIVWPKVLKKFIPEPPKLPMSTHKMKLGPEEIVDNHSQSCGPKVSVIIPVYNEGAASLVKHLRRLDTVTHGKSCTEILIVDAGCTDDTMDALKQVHSHLPIMTVKSESGRGQALSTGADCASGDILLFLHSDTELPDSYDEILRSKLADRKVLMTAFSFEINVDDVDQQENSRFIRGVKRLEHFTNIRARRMWLPYGDQALAMRKSAFREVGGIKKLRMMEDFELVSRVRRIALDTDCRIEILPETAKCSPRRWEKNGIAKNSLLNWGFVAAYVWGGVSPDQIFEYYYMR